jgi:hypothetical protein
VWLSSDWFIGFTDPEKKNHEPNQTRSVSIGSDRFQTEPNKVGYFFCLVRFGLSVSLVLSEPLSPLDLPAQFILTECKDNIAKDLIVKG